MALFSKPPAKKPDSSKPVAKPAIAATPRAAVSARDVAVQAQAQGRRGTERPRAEPVGDLSMTGASLIEWSPVRTSIEVAQTNPGMCAVLENAALLFASGQAKPARTLLEQGVVDDHDAKHSQLAWLALFDLMQRAGDRTAFDRLALDFVVQFERSPPAWEEGGQQPVREVKVAGGGLSVLTGKLTAATSPQIESLRRTMARPGAQTRVDLANVAGFDDAGARLLAEALAEARKRAYTLVLVRGEKVRAALEVLVRRGREAGEGAWLLLLEFLQFEHKQEAFDDRAVEYAVAFEQSPPSWEPPPVPPAAEAEGDATGEEAPAETAPTRDSGPLVWTGVMTGPSTSHMARISEQAYTHPVVVLDMTAVERIDFVCAGALLNAINRVESQRKAVQVVGATPILRALLLLIGISPRHFVKKPQ